jgi:predicted Zn-dependent protease
MHGKPALMKFMSVILAGSASFAAEPKVTRPFYNTFSDNDEVRIGRSAAPEIEKKRPILHDLLLDTYLNGIGQKLARASQHPGFEFHFQIVNSPGWVYLREPRTA